MNLTSKQFRSIVPGKPSSIYNDGNIHDALKLYKKHIKDCEIVQQCYERNWFEPKTVKRRKQLERAKFVESKNAERIAQ